MLQLNDLLPPEQMESYWTILGSQFKELEDGKEYAIFEHYCSSSSCDCKTLLADIQEIGLDGEVGGKPVALIDYDWSSKKTACEPTLRADSPKTALAINLLAVYKEYIHNGIYLTRIKGQYAKVKTLALQNQSHQAHNPKKNIGRNDPCHCGSNKKYKKCCLNT